MINKIEISEEGIIFCDGLLCVLDSLYGNCSECGDCPIIKIHYLLLDLDYDCGFFRFRSEREKPEKGV